jgi:hypothetical protein
MDAVEDIAVRLAEMDRQYKCNDLAGIIPNAQQVSQLSAEIGLTSLARVARDVAISAKQGNVVAYAAIWARLVRVGDASLAQVWEVPGLSL